MDSRRGIRAWISKRSRRRPASGICTRTPRRRGSSAERPSSRPSAWGSDSPSAPSPSSPPLRRTPPEPSCPSSPPSHPSPSSPHHRRRRRRNPKARLGKTRRRVAISAMRRVTGVVSCAGGGREVEERRPWQSFFEVGW